MRGLNPEDLWLLLRAWLLLSAVSAGLRVLGLQRMQAALGLAAAPRTCREGLPEAKVIARLVHAAANRNPLRPNCLARSLVLARELRRRGFAADIRLGVAKPNSRLTAHAWVEHNGVALAETEATQQSYAAFDAGVLNR